MKNWEEVVNRIKDYFENDPSEFEEVIEELDQIDGILGDDRYYAMDELDDLYDGEEPSEVLRRAFYGHDDDSWTYDSHGEKNYGQFNPNREYFYFNGYGNLVSTDYRDYSTYLDEYFIQELIDNRDKLNLEYYFEELLDELLEEEDD